MRFNAPGLNSGKGPNRSVNKDIVRVRVVIADEDWHMARRLSDYLWDHGCECSITSTISSTKKMVESWQPDYVFIDLMLPETNAVSLCKFVRSQPLKKIPQVIVMSKQTLPQGIETMRRAGAAHYLVKPFAFDEALRALASPAGEVAIPSVAATGNTGDSMAGASVKELHLLNLFLKQTMIGGVDPSSLFNLMRMISLKVHALRCSFIRCLNEDTAVVMASNDDVTVQGLAIPLVRYPEVREVRRTGRPLIIRNVLTCDLLAPVQEHLSQTPYESMALFPIFWRNDFYGVLSLRMQQKGKSEICYVEKFGEVCAQIISLAINSKAL